MIFNHAKMRERKERNRKDSRGMLYYEPLSQWNIVIGNIYGSQIHKLENAVREKRARRASVHIPTTQGRM